MVTAPVPKIKVASDMETQTKRARNNLMEFMINFPVHFRLFLSNGQDNKWFMVDLS